MSTANRPKSVTRQDVARLAEVSTAVVSYVINDGPRPVAAKTRQRVLDAIEQLEYRPSATARALKLGTTCTYGVSVPDVTNTFHAAIVSELDREMSERGWSMLLAHAHKDPEKETQIINNMINRGVEGMILLMSSTDDDLWFERRSVVPTVLMDRQRGLFGHVTIGPDYMGAGVMATEHLLGHGCKTVVPVFGSLIVGDRNLRMTGYQRAMYNADLPEMAPIVTAWSRDGGYQAGKILLESGVLPDGIFCFSDMIAVGMLKALQEAGVRVPEDIAIVCFDGTSAAKYASPGLTSVTQPVRQMAAAAVSALGEPSPAGLAHQTFPVVLKVRRSCGCVDQEIID